MDFKGLCNKGKLCFEQNKGLIFTILAAGFEVAAVVAMAKQAPKAEKVLIPANKKVSKIKEELKDTEAIANNLIDPKEHKKEMRKIQRQTFGQLAKIYALPVIFTGASLAFLGGSYKVMKNREIAIGAAYVTLDNAFKSYRGRVKEKFGADAEDQIFRDIREEKVSKEIVDKKTGEIKEIEETIDRAHSGGAWEILFDGASRLYTRNGRMNWESLMERQKQANISLNINGYLFLYDVIKLLEIPDGVVPKDLLIASKVIGWIYDPFDPNRSNFVSFGISDELGNPMGVGKSMFDNNEREVYLSFNPDGNILTSKNNNSFAFHVRN